MAAAAAAPGIRGSAPPACLCACARAFGRVRACLELHLQPPEPLCDRVALELQRTGRAPLRLGLGGGEQPLAAQRDARGKRGLWRGRVQGLGKWVGFSLYKAPAAQRDARGQWSGRV